jgi:xylulokinase
MSLMGIDVGSTGTKAVVFDAEGNQVASSYREYPEVHPQPGWIELEPERIWDAVKTVIGEAAAEAKGDPVRALGISAFGESFTPIDENGNYLCNTITSPDARCVKQAESWRERLGELAVFEITGMPLHASFTLNKIMWLREEAPDVYAKTWKCLLWPDMIWYKLGLEPITDDSLAGRTMAYDVVKRDWSDTMLDAADVSAELFAKSVPSGTVLGEIPARGCEELGLPTGVLAIASGHDQPMNALGAGVIREGMAVDGMGTVGCITVAFDQPVLNEKMLRNNFCCYPHAAPDMYASLAFTYSSGSVLRWYRDNFAAAEMAQAEESGEDVYDIILSDLPDDPTGLFIVPYFAGSGTPYLDALATGVIVGLDLSVDRKSFVKGILEGICYELHLNISRLAEAGVNIDKLRATGGGSKSPYWLQLKADITGKEVVTLNVTESGCQAGAMLGGVATGEYGSVSEAVEALVKEGSSFSPDPKRHARYQEQFATYREIWPQVRELARRSA